MKEQYIEDRFKALKGHFDIASPREGHKARFADKLNQANVNSTKGRSSFWKPLMIAAACIVVCLGVFSTMTQNQEINDLASVSPELAKTQDFFTVTIAEELKKLDAEHSPLTEDIIYDAMRELKHLETAYQTLKIDLKESGQDQRVIYAMISNFQTRIDILTNVLEHIENLKQLKTKTNDTEITI